MALEHGPLVFSLELGEDWHKRETGMKKSAPPPAADWEVHGSAKLRITAFPLVSPVP